MWAGGRGGEELAPKTILLQPHALRSLIMPTGISVFHVIAVWFYFFFLIIRHVLLTWTWLLLKAVLQYTRSINEAPKC